MLFLTVSNVPALDIRMSTIPLSQRICHVKSLTRGSSIKAITLIRIAYSSRPL